MSGNACVRKTLWTLISLTINAEEQPSASISVSLVSLEVALDSIDSPLILELVNFYSRLAMGLFVVPPHVAACIASL